MQKTINLKLFKNYVIATFIFSIISAFLFFYEYSFYQFLGYVGLYPEEYMLMFLLYLPSILLLVSHFIKKLNIKIFLISILTSISLTTYFIDLFNYGFDFISLLIFLIPTTFLVFTILYKDDKKFIHIAGGIYIAANAFIIFGNMYDLFNMYFILNNLQLLSIFISHLFALYTLLLVYNNDKKPIKTDEKIDETTRLLLEIKTLKDNGLITDDEYAQKRMEIIQKM